MELATLFSAMWADHCALNAQVVRVHDLLSSQGPVRHDHIVLRTLRHPRLGMERMADVFLDKGHTRKDDYAFRDEHVVATHFEPRDPADPKIFICELRLEACSAGLQDVIEEFVEQIDEATLDRDDCSIAGRLWDLSSAGYDALRAESEFAAWFAAYGFRPAQFAVSVNDSSFADLPELNAFLRSRGVELDASGGEIMGGADCHVAQSWTLADEAGVHFSGGVRAIPACSYAFVQRYPLLSGKLYQGFAARPADRVIELASARR